nr:hypothetical protein [Chromobacterium haemolyticum]
MRLLGVVAERGGQVGVLSQGQRQQALAVVLLLQKLVHIQRGGVAHHVVGKIRAQAVAAHFAARRQGGGRRVQIAAAGVWVDGFKGMGGGLQLAGAAGRVRQPGGGLVLGQQRFALGVVVGCKLVQLVVAPLPDEVGHQGA